MRPRRWTRSHASDEDLLLLDEGELTRRRLARVRRHLRDCPACAERRRTLQQGLADLVRACRETPRPAPDAAAARASSPWWNPASRRERRGARLTRREEGAYWAYATDEQRRQAGCIAARMQRRPPPRAARLLAQLQEDRGRPGKWAGRRRPALAAAGLVVAAGLATLIVQHADDRAADVRGGGPAATAPGPALPRPDLTPGAVRAVSADEICRSGRTTAAPAVAASIARRVFEDYGADYRRADEYELDFLITPELGGAADARNLWPQPYGSTRWNAHVKDELEQLFRRLVCEGALDLSTAQREIATDWIAAYRRYFKTPHPRRDG